MALLDRPVRELLDAFSSSDPTPGGGSASALASAVGASLLIMVASLPRTRAGSDNDRTALSRAAAALTAIRPQLAEAVDADTAAYSEVVAAYKLPKGTDEEKATRKPAIQRALQRATDIPLGVMRLSAQALSQATVVAAHGHRGAASDVGDAIALLRAGLRGARLNVDINLDAIQDEAYTRSVRAEAERLAHEGDAAADSADAALRESGIQN
jgi:formiminotetrahydrofolate cyclodeaminase